MKYSKLEALYYAIFGPLVTYEGDPIEFLLHLSTLIFRNKLQRNILKFIMATLVINLCYFIYYVTFSNPTRTEVLLFLPIQITTIYFLVSYFFIYKYCEAYLIIFQDTLKYFKPISTGSIEAIRTIKKESKFAKLFSCFYLTVMLANLSLFLPWIGNQERIYFFINRFRKYFGQHTFIETFIHFTAYHGTYAVSIPLFLMIYCMLQIKFQFALLIENVENLNSLEGTSNTKNLKEDITYQKTIYRKLISCVKHHQDIKRFKQILSDLFYWPALTIGLSVLIFETSMIIFCLSKISPSDNYKMIFTVSLTTFCHVVYALVGQTISDESERLFMAVTFCNWYNWDKKNCSLLKILLIHTKEPMVITSSGIIVVSKVLILKSYKALYSMITFYQSMSTVKK